MSNVAECFRISPQQRRVLRLQAKDTDRPFVSWILLRWPGMPEPGVIAAATRAVVEEHEILRTRFQHQDGMAFPFQVIDSGSPAVVDETPAGAEEFTAGDLARRLEFLAKVLGETMQPRLYCRVIREGNGAPRLLLAARATMLDLPSLRKVAVRICQLTRRAAPRIPYEPVQYRDFSEWCHAEAGGAAESESGTFADVETLRPWRAQMRLREPRPGFHPERRAIDLDASLGRSLESFAESQAVSGPAILLGAWAILLSRWSGRDDIPLGYLSAARSRAELREVIGPLASGAPIEIQLSEERTLVSFAEMLDGKMQQLENGIHAYRWEDVQTDDADGRPAYAPVCFEVDDATRPLVEGAPEIEEVDQFGCSERFDLKLVVLGRGADLRLQMQYDAQSCFGANIESICEAFPAFLRECISAPSRKIGEVHGGTVLTPMGGAAGEAIPHFSTIVECWRQTVRRCGNAMALVAEDGSLTYAELDRRASRLARRLRESGVVPGDLVMIVLGRTSAAAVAIWGILKAGAAYVPMDPASPAARLEHVLADAGITLAVGDASCPWMPERRGCRLVNVEDLIKPDSDSDECADAIAADLPAYVIYTSGSTGTPKGVMISHGNLANYLSGLWQRVPDLRGCSAAIVSSLCMDLGNTTFFSSMCSGGTVHLVAYGICTDPRRFGEYMATHQIECLKIVPSHLASLLGEGGSARLLPTRYLICGGEKFPWALYEHIRRCRPTCEVFNHYGPTETTIGALMGRVPEPRATDAQSIPLGVALPGYEIYIVAKDGTGARRGFAGEICISGAGVAQKYLGGQRLRSMLADGRTEVYRTGDIARVSTHGGIEYLRRDDTQVKISGFRIEIGEIEACLQRIPAVTRGLVRAIDPGRGEMELCAFIVRSHRLPGLDVRMELARTLPSHMVPTRIVELDAIPLNANGKIDPRALRERALSGSRGTDADQPNSPRQRKIRDLWLRVLGGERMGVKSDFFAVGGTSLKAIGLVAAINREFDVQMSLADIFDHRTVEAQAALVARLAPLLSHRIEPVEDREWYPASSAQQRLYVVDQLRPGSTAYNMPMGVEIRGALDADEIRRAFDELIVRHEILRTALLEYEGDIRQRVHPACQVPLLCTEDASTPPAVLLERFVRPFRLDAPPLVRAHLVRRGPEHYLLLIDRHHITSDNISTRIFANDLFALYQRRPLAPLAVRYRDYAVWERGFLASPAYAVQMQYWRERLGRGPSEQPFRLDRPYPLAPTFAGGVETFELTTEQLALLDDACAELECTRFAALLAAYRISIHCLTGQPDVVLGTDVANRDQEELQNVMGIFVNQLTIRTVLAPDHSVRQAIETVASAVVDALRHRHLPFDRLVKELQPSRDASLQPIFKNKFVLTEEGEEAWVTPGLQVSPLASPDFMAKFDTLTAISVLPRSIHGSIQYNRELFDQGTVQGWIETFLDVLELSFADLDRRIETVGAEQQLRQRGRHATRSDAMARAKRKILQQKLFPAT